ncbi:MAG: M20 family metallo-hydrolase [Roseovarius sp.]|nr:M20 family metallo-hydrolase [Roseovarius sp.]
MDERHSDFLRLFQEFASFGAFAGGGVNRLVASAEDGAARDHLCNWLRGHGFEVQVDAVGNIYGIINIAGAVGGGTFYCGSHLDSQPMGGRFDGALGVVCACHAALAARRAADEGRLHSRYSRLVVVCWTGEEGARYQPSLLGSRVATGDMSASDALAICDADDVALGDALDAIGYRGGDTPPPPDGYLELHIEQGTALEKSGCAIGVVTGCWGARKLRIAITGVPAHTGPTPMADRRDALLAAALIITEVHALARDASAVCHSSVAQIEVQPNSPNTVAASARLWVELRSGDEAALGAMTAGLDEALNDAAEQTGCTVGIEHSEIRAAVPFDAGAIARIEAVLDNAKIPQMRLPTIAGHDAVQLQSVCPASLIFVPSKGGISHAPEEFTSDADMIAGLDAMTHALLALLADGDVEKAAVPECITLEGNS